ncbi:MAG TPA: multidrug ABC transporter ATP-binding protein [Alphaproteobacteria bacterium]|jgi:ABC-2 type transport system ATP-binding protein|nr:multidrug ABC transporter ATP-binding protein [Alphaproteobacteria bacterium]HAM46471.1 multidrug ABC transporter ATP-binding protein [Alphaproteobacteria bacterium]HBA44345.1 multidrug ABC transporter ATP-binding protein [Alphaproteobacteria bacterium]HBC54829.1 multidrug ABC transporter ATP-binding protein [Alphaproteobacteria bacterium]
MDHPQDRAETSACATTHDATDGNAANGKVQTGQNAISAHNLQKHYRGEHGQPPKHALKGIDLEIPRGSIFGLLGPNGAGKSTFINILAGLVIKSSGQVSIWGFDIDRNPRQARASIGVVPQELNIDPFFTPAEILELQAGMYGVPKAQRRTADILAAMGLSDKADAYTRTLSGGMRRRLLVAKAMVHAPPILVLDEPTAGVDVELRQQLWDYVRDLHRQGTTIVLTTHYLEEAEELCDQIAIINHGEVAACEPTPQLLSRIDEKILLVRPDSPIEGLAAELSEFQAELKPDGQIAIAYRPSETSVEEILARLRAHAIAIRDLTTVESDLEDIFLQLTRERA